MLDAFLSPLSPKLIGSTEPDTFGEKVVAYIDNFPDWEVADLAIIGVPDGRHGKHNHESSEAPDQIRKAFYHLSCHKSEVKIVDLGNITKGITFEDTEAALQEVVSLLVHAEVTPIILGGSKQLGYSIYQAMTVFKDNIECSIISPYINTNDGELINDICTDEPNQLFNLNVLGYQGHYATLEQIETLETLFFNPLRLGMLKANLNEAEPILRNTDMLLYDIGSIKQSDAPGNYYNNPSGLSAEEACQISWYAGISETMNVMGLFEINPEYDYRDTTSKLGAQLLWYFIDGFYSRKGDHPSLHKEFQRYRCALNDRQPDILFFKSKRTDRWWMEIPNLKDSNSVKNVLIPCAYNDYKMATKGDMPDRFFNALQRMPK
jgi:formiminoglutamase